MAHQLIASHELPPKLLESHREANLLTYGPSLLLVALKDSAKDTAQLGTIRVAMREHDSVKHGLIADLHADSSLSAPQKSQLKNELIAGAEKYLKERGATKIDAVVIDGHGLTEPFLNSGYWASRKTVAVRWNLAKLKTAPTPLENIAIDVVEKFDVEEFADFILSSYQPYYQWWKNDAFDRIWERIDYPALPPDDVEKKNLRDNRARIIAELRKNSSQDSAPAVWVTARLSSDGSNNGKLIGLCDARAIQKENEEQILWGVLMEREHPGKGFGQLLLLTALHWLASQGLKTASTIATSGMDDFDPTVYLYTLSGAKIEGEFLNLVKRKL